MEKRNLRFETLAEAVDETKRLLDQGYVPHGKWSLGQICRHLALIQDGNVDGFPKWFSLFAFVRPFAKAIFLKKIMNGNSPNGLPTAPMYNPPKGIVDAVEVALYEASVERFLKHEGEYHPHPGFGRLSRSEMEKLHAMHAAHHLSFLEPDNGQKKSENSSNETTSV